MPIYEYQCQACGHQFDKLQKMSDSALTDCPECHKPELRKMISAPSFKLTGTGWYETDFKNKNAKKESKKEEAGTTPAAAEKKPEKSKDSETKAKKED